MRRYTDLNIRSSENTKELQKTLRKASEIGYSTVAVSFTSNANEHIQDVKAFCRSIGLDMATRVDLQPESSGSLFAALGRLRPKFDVLAVRSTKKEISRLAAKDKRVDILNYRHGDTANRRLYFDHQEAAIASDSLCSLEIEAATILESNPLQKARALSTMIREAGLAKKFNVPIVISSGASDPYGLRTPRDLASLLTLLDLDLDTCLRAVSETPTLIANRNRARAQAFHTSLEIMNLE